MLKNNCTCKCHVSQSACCGECEKSDFSLQSMHFALRERIENLEKFLETLNYCKRIYVLENISQSHEEYLKKINEIALCDPDKVAHNYNNLNIRIDKLENTNYDERIHDLENISAEIRLIKLEKDFQRKLNIDEEKWREYFSLIPLNNKKVYKRPVCEGGKLLGENYHSLSANEMKMNIKL